MAPSKKWLPTFDYVIPRQGHISMAVWFISKECVYPSHRSVFWTNISDQINWTAFLHFSCFQIIWCYLLGKFLGRATNSQLVVCPNHLWSHVSETHMVWTCRGHHSARSDLGQRSDKFFSSRGVPLFPELQQSLILSPVGQLQSLEPSCHSFIGYAKLNNTLWSFQSHPRVPTLHLTLNSGFTEDYVALVQAVWHAAWVCWDWFPRLFLFREKNTDFLIYKPLAEIVTDQPSISTSSVTWLWSRSSSKLPPPVAMLTEFEINKT